MATTASGLGNCKRFLWATLACVGLQVGLLPAQEAVSTDQRKAPEERLLAALETLRVQAQIPGLSVALVDHGELVFARGLGYSHPEEGIAATGETLFDIASVTKPLSATVILGLAEEGLVDLDRPIAEYSDWAEFCEAFAEQSSIFARDLQCDPPLHTLRHMLSHTVQGKPGEHFSYNPVIFSWASRPIMAATGMNYSDLVTERLFDPVGMSHSARKHRARPIPELLARDLAPPHMLDESGRVVASPPMKVQGDGAAGGVISTVTDLARFDIALDSGKLISSESRAMMMTPVRSSTGEPQPHGLGWFVQEYKGTRLVWHSGWWEDAYSALYLKVPEHETTIILLANSEGLWWDNPLDEARVEGSAFARAFLSLWLGIE
jgi:CubicO group peptidase (beta-lactamase class C family)